MLSMVLAVSLSTPVAEEVAHQPPVADMDTSPFFYGLYGRPYWGLPGLLPEVVGTGVGVGVAFPVPVPAPVPVPVPVPLL